MAVYQRYKVAHLRSLDYPTDQCELRFHLCVSINGVVLNEEIRAVRDSGDTVGSLLQEVQDKLNELIQTKSRNAAYTPLRIPLRLEYNGEEINSCALLEKVVTYRTVHVFRILRENFEVVVNSPLIQSVVLPTVIYKKTIIHPVQFQALHTEKRECQSEWYSSADKVNWILVGCMFTYKVQQSDLGRYLKYRCIPKSCTGVVGEAFEVISERAVMTVPWTPKCPFHDRQQLCTPSKLTGKQFRVVSYNILSNYYARSSDFPYCPAEFLNIEYRKRILWQELSGYNADIICLQELDFKEYEHFFKGRFKKFDYKSVFHRKGNRSFEGMGCIYNPKKFDMIHSDQFVLSSGYQRIKYSVSSHPDVQKFRSLPSSLQVSVFQSRMMKKRLIVANTHMYYHPDGNQIRVLQAAVITRFLLDLKTQFQMGFKGTVSIILCGDFNSMPNSPTYHFLANGELTEEHMENLPMIKYEPEFTHSFEFESACGTPKYTNFTKEFKACLDYIFYDKECLKSTCFVPFPDENVLSQNVALPSRVFPSDHVALVADMEFL